MLSKQWFDCVVAVNQVAVVSLDTPPVRLVARITAVNTLDAQQRADSIVYHCFRGRYTPNTTMYLSMSEGDEAALTAQLQRHSVCETAAAGVGHVTLTNRRCVDRCAIILINHVCAVCDRQRARLQTWCTCTAATARCFQSNAPSCDQPSPSQARHVIVRICT